MTPEQAVAILAKVVYRRPRWCDTGPHAGSWRLEVETLYLSDEELAVMDGLVNQPPERFTPGPAPWPRRGVWRLEPGRWAVPSQGTPGALWEVAYGHDERDGNYLTCTCPAGRERGRMGGGTLRPPCRHCNLVAAVEREDGHPPRLTPPPNVEGLVG